MGKITKDGVFIEELERNPGRFLPEVSERHTSGGAAVGLRHWGCHSRRCPCCPEALGWAVGLRPLLKEGSHPQSKCATPAADGA